MTWQLEDRTECVRSRCLNACSLSPGCKSSIDLRSVGLPWEPSFSGICLSGGVCIELCNICVASWLICFRRLFLGVGCLEVGCGALDPWALGV